MYPCTSKELMKRKIVQKLRGDKFPLVTVAEAAGGLSDMDGTERESLCTTFW